MAGNKVLNVYRICAVLPNPGVSVAFLSLSLNESTLGARVPRR
jgi:hypothetical protein